MFKSIYTTHMDSYAVKFENKALMTRFQKMFYIDAIGNLCLNKISFFILQEVLKILIVKS